MSYAGTTENATVTATRSPSPAEQTEQATVTANATPRGAYWQNTADQHGHQIGTPYSGANWIAPGAQGSPAPAPAPAQAGVPPAAAVVGVGLLLLLLLL